MEQKISSLALATTVALSLGSSAALAASGAAGNPFAITELPAGYQLAGVEGKCGEAKCGGSKSSQSIEAEKIKEAKCGEAKCGGSKPAPDKSPEGKCGEAKCGGKA